MTTRSEIELQVRRRANGRCEYCQMHQSLQGATFHVEHVIPRSRGGGSQQDNPAWACPSCNLHKSDRVDVPESEGGEIIRLYNPRTDRWHDHFRWHDYQVTGITSVGRATVETLFLNDERRVKIRQAEELFALFPPNDED